MDVWKAWGASIRCILWKHHALKSNVLTVSRPRAAAVCVGALSLVRKVPVWLRDTAMACWESSAWPPRRWRWSCNLIMWLSPPSTTLPMVSQVDPLNGLSKSISFPESLLTFLRHRSRDPVGGKRRRGGGQQPGGWLSYSSHWRPQRSSGHHYPLCERTGQLTHGCASVFILKRCFRHRHFAGCTEVVTKQDPSFHSERLSFECACM